VVVGDIALLEPGEIVPCDGVFLSGYNVKCDESGATGESDAIKKVPYDECIALRQIAMEEEGADGGVEHMGSGGMGHTDCFVVSGSKVLEGMGSYVVVAVGTKSFNGRIMMGLFYFLPLIYRRLTSPQLSVGMRRTHLYSSS
jgi:P-type Ca2+ transporter type 2C